MCFTAAPIRRLSVSITFARKSTARVGGNLVPVLANEPKKQARFADRYDCERVVEPAAEHGRLLRELRSRSETIGKLFHL
jgi:hypothetical protein